MSDDEQPKVMRAPDGKLLPGSQLGKLGAGIPKGKATADKIIARERRAMQKQLKEAAESRAGEILADNLEDVLGALYERAMQGDTQAMGLWLRHSVAPAKPSNKVDTDVLSEIYLLPAEERLRYINRAVLQGEVDVQMGRDLLAAQKSEMEATTLLRLQRLARRAATQGIDPIAVCEELASICQDLEPVEIEHEG